MSSAPGAPASSGSAPAGGGGRVRVLFEAWRCLPHSYAVLAMNYARELLRRPEMDLRWRDMPLYMPEWTPTTGMLMPDDEAAVLAIPEPEEGWHPHVVIRCDYPHRFAPVSGARVLMLGTTEMGVCLPTALRGADLRRDVDGERVRIVTPSAWSREGFLRSGARAAAVSVATLGVDTNIYRPLAPHERARARADMGLSDGFYFLNVSGMTNNKGVSTMLTTIGEIAARGHNARLILKGLDSLYNSGDRVEEMLASTDPGAAEFIRTRVAFVGQNLSLTDLVRLFAAADCYYAPYTAEGFCMPALEAQACGVPVITTRGGPTDAFLHPECTLFVPSEIQRFTANGQHMMQLKPRHSACLEHMERVMKDSGLRERAARVGPAHVAGAFTWRHATDLLIREFGIA